ncbi:Fe-S cluster assembly protein SufD [Pseudochelatococcus lubricantis]|uniref:Fe-S cluster assembly protein SufD n=1 Tax=Pseudochelatococcus lubricantis TaxID=1538102 RepID=UPI0035EA3757
MTDITPIRTQAETQLLDYLRHPRSALPVGDGSVIRRADAIARLEREGLPNRRVEEWKYTDLRALLREAAPPAECPSAADIAEARAQARVFAEVAAVRLDFVNGHLAAQDAPPAGVTVIGLAQALAEEHPVLSNLNRVDVAAGNASYELNRAFLSDGVVVHVAAEQAVAQPLHLRFVNRGGAPFSTAPRVLVVLDKRTSLTVLESHEGDVAAQPNSVVEFVLADDAQLEHARVNTEAAGTIALSTITAVVGTRAAFRSVNLHAGTSVSRHQLFVAYEGEDARVTLGGVTVLSGTQHADTTLVVDHAVPGGESRELFKTVIDGEAKGVFQGKIVVRPDAQKTDGRMMSAALLLSPDATMNNKPELEIWADDVQCAHGATCGELDDELLFYLTARGLPREEAEALLLQAFIGEALELVTDEAIREAMTGLAIDRLAKLA